MAVSEVECNESKQTRMRTGSRSNRVIQMSSAHFVYPAGRAKAR